MMATIPAWKKLGLQVKDDVTPVSFNGPVHIENANVDNKLAKKLNKKRRREEEEKKKSTKEKKPPKRVKLPKSERAPPPEKDQLAYLRLYATDRDNWKFSKQKQNWLIKNLNDIPQEYEDMLIKYIESIQGGARDRLVAQLVEVANQWNKVCKAIEDKVNAELYGGSDDSAEKEKEEKKEEEEGESGPQVTRENAIRTKKLLHALTDDPVEILGLEEDAEEESNEGEEETLSKKNDAEVAKESTTENHKSEESASSDSEKADLRQNASEDSENEQNEENLGGSKDNLIIEHVDVEDYFEDSDPPPPKKTKKLKLHKSGKKSRRSSSASK